MPPQAKIQLFAMNFAIDNEDETSAYTRYQALEKVVKSDQDREWTMFAGQCFAVSVRRGSLGMALAHINPIRLLQLLPLRSRQPPEPKHT